MRFYSNLVKYLFAGLMGLTFTILPGHTSAQTMSLDDIKAKAEQIFMAVENLQKQVESLEISDQSSVQTSIVPVSDNNCVGLNSVAEIQNCEQVLKSNIVNADTAVVGGTSYLQTEDVSNMANVLVAARAILLRILEMGGNN
jgi:hypothetical protein